MPIAFDQKREPIFAELPPRPVTTTVKVDDEDGFHELIICSEGKISIRTMNDNHAAAVDEFVDPKFANYLSSFIGRMVAQSLKKQESDA